MKPQIALTPDQMHELQSLGLDCSDASMICINFNGTYAYVGGEEAESVRDCANGKFYVEISTAYTLEDVISKLAMKIDWVPRINKPMKWQSCRFSKYFYADTPLDAAFVMLKYAIKNHPDKIKKLE